MRLSIQHLFPPLIQLCTLKHRRQHASEAVRIQFLLAPFHALRVSIYLSQAFKKIHFLEYTCQPSAGCCPVVLVPSAPATPAPAPTTQAPKMILVQLTTCPGTNTPPVSSCGSCPTGYSCAPLLGACCPGIF